MSRKADERVRAIAALVREPTVERAAAASGVPAARITALLKDHGFLSECRLAVRESYALGAAMAVRLTPVAVQTLAQIMVDSAAPSSSRVAAATEVLRFATSIESVEIAERIDRLERGACDADD